MKRKFVSPASLLLCALFVASLTGCALIPVKPVRERAPKAKVKCERVLIFYGNDRGPTGSCWGTMCTTCWGAMCSTGKMRCDDAKPRTDAGKNKHKERG